MIHETSTGFEQQKERCDECKFRFFFGVTPLSFLKKRFHYSQINSRQSCFWINKSRVDPKREMGVIAD